MRLAKGCSLGQSDSRENSQESQLAATHPSITLEKYGAGTCSGTGSSDGRLREPTRPGNAGVIESENAEAYAKIGLKLVERLGHREECSLSDYKRLSVINFNNGRVAGSKIAYGKLNLVHLFS